MNHNCLYFFHHCCQEIFTYRKRVWLERCHTQFPKKLLFRLPRTQFREETGFEPEVRSHVSLPRRQDSSKKQDNLDLKSGKKSAYLENFERSVILQFNVGDGIRTHNRSYLFYQLNYLYIAGESCFTTPLSTLIPTKSR